MHAAERERLILEILRERPFVGFKELEHRIEGSSATLRRDLSRLGQEGKIIRFHGGARLSGKEGTSGAQLQGVPLHQNVDRNRKAKEAIGRTAAGLCRPDEAVIIDGGSTTLQMCTFLAPLSLHVVTNSLHIVSALLPQENTRISVPAGTLFREQSIIFSPFEDDGMDRYHAAKLFLGAAAVGRRGLMQTDVLLVEVKRRMLKRADEVIVLADSSKFDAPTGHFVCALKDIDTLITDEGLSDAGAKMLEQNDIKIVIAPRA